jgi:uncharacterized Ntn-hydrolase superfamily protein
MARTRQALPPIATFSIVGADVARGELGIAVASKFLACGAVVPWASAGAGAVATQSYSNTAYGPDGIRMMREGLSAEQTLARLLAEDPDRALRQVGIVDARGGAAAHTGSGCHGWAGHVTGPSFAAQGNILVGEDTVKAMALSFQSSTGALSDRLVNALARGEAAGGDRRGRQASAVTVVKAAGGYGGKNDVLVDLRVDDHPNPVVELRRLLDLQHLYFGSSPQSEKLALTGPLLAEICAMMRRLHYLPATATDDWNDATAKAFDAFTSTENIEERVDIPARCIDPPALDYLRKTYG